MFKRSNSVELFTNKVMDYMTDDYILVKKSEFIKSAIEKLKELKKSTILVEENDQVCGIITEKDILKRVAFNANEQTTVNQVMSQPVKFVYLSHASQPTELLFDKLHYLKNSRDMKYHQDKHFD